MGACASKPLTDEDMGETQVAPPPRGERPIPSPEAKKANARQASYQVDKNFASKSIVEGLQGAYSVVKLCECQ